jgi:hypothetical protein
MWLLLMLVTLGLYLAAQTWARLRKEGVDVVALAGNVALPDRESPASAARPPATAGTAAPNEDVVPAPQAAPSSAAKSGTAKAASGPASSATSPKVANAARSEVREPNDAPGPVTAKQPSPLNTRPTDRLDIPGPAPAARPQPGPLEAMSESVGAWFVEWQDQRAASRREGLRMAAAAVGRYAKAAKQMPVSVIESPQNTSATVPREVTPATRSGGTHVPPLVADTPGVAGPANGPTLGEPAAGESPRQPRGRAGLSIHNPRRSGGAVHYLVNGREHTLQPGESQQLPGGQWLIEFHRGGDYGEAASTLAAGNYRFEITANGWDLRRRDQ